MSDLGTFQKWRRLVSVFDERTKKHGIANKIISFILTLFALKLN
jgi:hypothetical protein